MGFEKLEVVGVGDNTVDIFINQGRYYPGGNCVNFSVFAKRLGAQSSYIGILGNDERGRHIYDALEKEDVNIERVRIENCENSFAKVKLVNNDRIFLSSNPKLSQSLKITKKDIEFLKNVDLIHTSIFSNINNELKNLSKYNFKISYDFSNKYYKYDFNEKDIFPFIDYGFFSFDDFSEKEIYKFINEIQNSYNIEIVVTAGENGSYAVNKKNELIHFPAKNITPLDTIGAGDAYISCYLLSRLKGVNKIESMKKSTVFAIKICLKSGSFGYGKSFENK